LKESKDRIRSRASVEYPEFRDKLMEDDGTRDKVKIGIGEEVFGF